MRLSVSLVLLTFACESVANPGSTFEGGYTPHGSVSTQAFEVALYNLLPVYALGVEPSEEKSRSAIPGEFLPQSYIHEATRNIGMVLQPESMSRIPGGLQFFGYRKLAWNTNVLIARYTDREGRFTILFLCRARDLGIAVTSETLFPREASGLSQNDVIQSANKILNIPTDKLPKIHVWNNFAVLEGVPLSYGIMRCEWNELTPDVGQREWWSSVPYWITKGKMFVSVSTYDWKSHGRDASDEDPWKWKF